MDLWIGIEEHDNIIINHIILSIYLLCFPFFFRSLCSREVVIRYPMNPPYYYCYDYESCSF